jgi:CheY-like chemotaxis protein
MLNAAQPAAAGLESLAYKKPTILVVDDASRVRLIVSLSLRARGFDVIEAATGAAAKAIVSQVHAGVDLVFCDISEDSRIAGLELLAWLLDTQPAIPLLLASKDARSAEAARGLRAQLPIIQKPYDLDVVAARLWTLAGAVD